MIAVKLYQNMVRSAARLLQQQNTKTAAMHRHRLTAGGVLGLASELAAVQSQKTDAKVRDRLAPPTWHPIHRSPAQPSTHSTQWRRGSPLQDVERKLSEFSTREDTKDNKALWEQGGPREVPPPARVHAHATWSVRRAGTGPPLHSPFYAPQARS